MAAKIVKAGRNDKEVKGVDKNQLSVILIRQPEDQDDRHGPYHPASIIPIVHLFISGPRPSCHIWFRE
jgi:hypothetical protein